MSEYTDEQLAEIRDGLLFLEGCFSRFNDWTSDRVPGEPIEICRHGNQDIGEDYIIVLRRYPSTAVWTEETARLHFVREQQLGFLKQKLGLS